MATWHGWRLDNGKTLGIGPLPGRKGVAIYYEFGQEFIPLGYFRSEEAAQQALKLLDEIANAKEVRFPHGD